MINLLMDVEKRYLNMATQELEKAGVEGISILELRTLGQLCLEGTRAQALPKRLRMTKQAVSQALTALERQGLIERKPDPDDRRAKLVTFTPMGFKRVTRALQAAMEVERKLGEEIGSDQLALLKETLSALTASSPRAASATVTPRRKPAPRGREQK